MKGGRNSRTRENYSNDRRGRLEGNMEGGEVGGKSMVQQVRPLHGIDGLLSRGKTGQSRKLKVETESGEEKLQNAAA